MKWLNRLIFGHKNRTTINPYIKDGNVHVNLAKCEGRKFIDLDGVILYLKHLQTVDPENNNAYHKAIKGFVKFKNES